MKLSILLSAYNGSNYLKEQLDSIVNQTYKPFEVILIDDCSTDNGATWEIFQEYRKNYNFIKTYKNQENYGYEKSFMNGINYVKGDILLFSDHDDVWDKNKLKIINDCFVKQKIDGLLSAVKYKIEVSKAPEYKKRNNIKHTDALVMNKFKFDEHFIHTKGEACALALKMNFVNKYKNLWVKDYAHDDFWECLLTVFGKLAYYDGALVTRRIHDNNKTALKHDNKETALKYLKIRKELCLNIIHKTNNKLSNNKIKLINEYIAFSEQRITALNNKNINAWLTIPSNNMKFYNNKAAWIRDLLWIFIKT